MSGRFAVPEGNIVLYDKIFLSVLWPVHLTSIALKRLIMRHYRKRIEISGTIGFDDLFARSSYSTLLFSLYVISACDCDNL
jgi:hypothetical protein